MTLEVSGRISGLPAVALVVLVVVRAAVLMAGGVGMMVSVS